MDDINMKLYTWHIIKQLLTVKIANKVSACLLTTSALSKIAPDCLKMPLKVTDIRLRLGLCPRPRWGSTDWWSYGGAPPDPLAGLPPRYLIPPKSGDLK